MNTLAQGDLLADETFARIIPIKVSKKQALKDADFQPVVLAEAPAEILAMPEDDLQQKIEKTKAVLKWAMSKFEICFSYSGGKDSSTVLSIGLTAAREMKAEGIEVKRFAILNSNTLVENPEVLKVVQSELVKIQQWIDRFDLPGTVRVTTPALASQFAVSIIGGKSIVSTPTSNRNCTTDWKSIPLGRARDQLFGKNDVANGRFVVGVTGVRFGESHERNANMTKRAESPVQVVQTDAKQNVFLAPIAYWSSDDVMEFIGYATSDILSIETYSDLKEVWRVYKDAEGECTVGKGDTPSRGCTPRHGCHCCLMVSDDKSMDGFLAREEYAYMEPLARFREFLGNTLFDMSKRTWVGRSIKNGYIEFAPDAYAPHFLQDLLRYALTIDVREQEAAARFGIAPRFQLVSAEALIAICANWSLQGFALPFTGLKIYRDVYVYGKRYEMPVVPKAPKVDIPAPRFIWVGEQWDDNEFHDFTGLRNPILEMVEGSCSSTKTITSKGETRHVMDVDAGDLFTVHAESIEMLLMFELDRLVDEYHGENARMTMIDGTMAGQGYKFYLRYGTISLAKNQVAKVDQILRRTAWRERFGLAGYQYDHEAALAMSIAAIPEQAVPTIEELREQAKKQAETRRAEKRAQVLDRAWTVADLYKHWAPDVSWRKLLLKNKTSHKSTLPCRKVPAYCRNTKPQYSSNYRKGWALHHFVLHGSLVAFLKQNPDVAEKVKAHRSPMRKRGFQQKLLFVA